MLNVSYFPCSMLTEILLDTRMSAFKEIITSSMVSFQPSKHEQHIRGTMTRSCPQAQKEWSGQFLYKKISTFKLLFIPLHLPRWKSYLIKHYIQAQKAAFSKNVETGIKIMAKTKPKIQRPVDKKSLKLWSDRVVWSHSPCADWKVSPKYSMWNIVAQHRQHSYVEASPFDNIWGLHCMIQSYGARSELEEAWWERH